MALRRKRERQRTDEPTAEELAVVHAVRAWGNQIFFGAPTRCPDCGGYGLVDRVDPVARASDNRCPVCGTTWTLTVRALVAADRAPEAAAPESVAPQAAEQPEPVAGGLLIDPLLGARRRPGHPPPAAPAFG